MTTLRNRLLAIACAFSAFAWANSALAAGSPAADCPELQALNALAGKWQGDFGAEGQAREIASDTNGEWVLKGNYLQSTIVLHSKADANAEKQEIMILWTYDRQKNVYRRWFFFNNGNAVEETGRWDAKEKAFHFESSDAEAGRKSDSVVRVVDANTLEWTITFESPKGDKVKILGTNRRAP